MKRIGITIDSSKSSIWSSGINQNAAYLALVLKKAGYQVDLISLNNVDNNFKNEIKNLIGLNTILISKAVHVRYSMVIELGFFITNQIVNSFKKLNKNIKVIAYKCGNDFIVDMESVIHESSQDRMEMHENNDRSIPDQIWSIPQMENTNLSYYKFLLKQDNATVVPFIWDPIAIESLNEKMKNRGYSTYKSKDIKKIAIMEPNISIMKNILHPIMTCDLLYRDFKFDKLMMISASKLKENRRLIQILKITQMFKDGKVSADSRYPTLRILNEHADIVLSWQWENNLNYLYLDVAWMGWPIVHNANLCQDIGYYYEGFNAEEAAEKMKYAIENHNQDLDYLERNREIIKRYTQENPKLIEQYKELVEDALNDKFKKRTYDWKTNLVS